MIVSCTIKDKEIKRKVKNENKIETKIIHIPTQVDLNAPEFYTKKDIDLPNTSKLLITLKKISNIKEVRNFSKINADTILYWVIESSIYKNSYLIHVGLDYGDHYSTKYIFDVNRRDDDIKILELVEDSLMSIEGWRKNPYYTK